MSASGKRKRQSQSQKCNCEISHPQVGDKVSVIRSSDPGGWYDGRLEAIVTSVYHKEQGGVSYCVVDDDGCTYVCNRRGDVRLLI